MDETRQQLLEAAFHEIHRQGFQAASLSAILRQTGVTKGALYHYFDSKQALGYAVLDEWVLPYLRRTWFEPLRDRRTPPLQRLKRAIARAGEELDEEAIRLGCPLNNLAQEMSPLDEGFRRRTDQMYRTWLESIAATLMEAREQGEVAPELDPEATALFILATLEGCMGIAKNAQSRPLLLRCGSGLLHYLELLSRR